MAKVKSHRWMSTEARFWAQVEKDGRVHPVWGQCWRWTGSKTGRDGRPIMHYGGRQRYTHRYSWMLHFGAIPDGLCVLHKCDNPECTNPAHLFLGTQQDNADDKVSKGRCPPVHGELNPRAKLTEGQVEEIRRRYCKGSKTGSCAALAREFKMSESAIRFIIRGRNWREPTEV